MLEHFRGTVGALLEFKWGWSCVSFEEQEWDCAEPLMDFPSGHGGRVA